MQLTQKQKTQGWRVVKFGEVAQEVRSSSKDPLAEGLDRFVALEHLDPESLKLARYGLFAEEKITFTKRFSAGHILFCCRRAYLRKVAVPEFDGICSPHLTVIAPNGEDILPGLLAYIIQSERFMAWAVKHSAGSLSPRVKFKALTEYQFALPPLPRQQELIALFTALDRSIEAAHQLARSTFQTRLSLISHHIHQAPNLREVKLGDVVQELNSHSKNPLAEGLECYVGLNHLDPESLKLARYGLFAEDKPTFTKRFSAGHTLFGRLRAYLNQVAIAEFDGICSDDILVLTSNGEDILPGLIPFIVQSKRFIAWAVKYSAGSTHPRVKFKSLAEFQFSLPPLPRQQKLITLFTTLDRSIEAQAKQQAAKILQIKKQAFQQLFEGETE